MKIPEQLSELRGQIENMLAPIEKKHDISIDVGNMSYEPDGSGFTCRMTVKNNKMDGKDIEQVDFERQCRPFGFVESDYNREFILDNETYVLSGFKPRARKKPCVIKNKKGVRYVVSPNLIKGHWKSGSSN